MALLKGERPQHRQTVKGSEIRVIVQRRQASGEIQLQHVMKKRAFFWLTFLRNRAGVLSLATRRHLEQHASHFSLCSQGTCLRILRLQDLPLAEPRKSLNFPRYCIVSAVGEALNRTRLEDLTPYEVPSAGFGMR